MQERQLQLNGLAINYKIIGSGKTPVVLLHGWGLSSDKYLVTAEAILKSNPDLKFFVPDLPGFGKSAEPATDWQLDDYVAFLKAFIRSAVQRETGFELVKNIIAGAIKNNGQVFHKEDKQVVVLAHSFGGRVAIKYAVRYPADLKALVLTGAAGIKHPLSGKQRWLYFLAKAGKKAFSSALLRRWEKLARGGLYRLVREKDYGRASARMQGVMKNALAEDLTALLPEIATPTFLIWGELDHSTPLSDGQLMAERIPGARLAVIANANHAAPYRHAEEFSRIFVEFINIEK